MALKLTNVDLDFWFLQLRLPNNQPAFPTDPTGIRDVKGTGNNVFNTWWGTADQLFPRLTFNALKFNPADPNTPYADKIASVGPYFQSYNTAATPYATRGTSFTISTLNDASNPRYVSKAVATSTAQSLYDRGVITANPATNLALAEKQAHLAVQDDPSLTPGGRLNPLTGNVNPLASSSFMGFFGQFFDHGLDFVHKGVDGKITIALANGDPIKGNFPQAQSITVDRTNTANITIGDGSKDALVTQLFANTTVKGLAYSVVQGTPVFDPMTIQLGPNFASVGGNLILDGRLIQIAAGATGQQIADAIAAAFPDGAIVPTFTGTTLVLTPASGESTNTISPFIDLSQSYGSVSSHLFFLKEYSTVGLPAGTGGVVTGRLVSGTADGLNTTVGMASWSDIKANALKIGITLHDYNVADVPVFRTNTDGSMYRDGNGKAWLVATNKTTGEIVYVQDTALDKLAAGNLVLLTTGHAFLDDIAHQAAAALGSVNAQGDIPAGANANLLNAHLVAGDGRTNENLGLTSIHDIFHSEHNGVVDNIMALFQQSSPGNYIKDAAGNYLDAQGRAWSAEDVFQTAKAVTEMQYQHLVFAEFARKLSPNINAFAAYDITLDPAVTAEFAAAVYRFGHSMMNENVAMEGVVNGISTGLINPLGGPSPTPLLLQAFLNPAAFDGSTSAEVALGTSKDVAYLIDEWMTPVLQNNTIGLPIDLGAANITRARDAGVPNLNAVRADLFAQTGLASLKPYDSWGEFGQNLLHKESLANFILAYASDYLIGKYGANGATLANAKLAAQDSTFLNASLKVPANVNDTLLSKALKGLNTIDLWMGGLAEAKVPGGMLGSTFDFIFAYQMIALQNADRFYYLTRLVGTDMLGEIDAQLFSDLVMRNTGLKHLYADIFSVPDNSIEIRNLTVLTPTQTQTYKNGPLSALDGKAPSFNSLADKNNFTVTTTDAKGNTVSVGVAGFVNGVFYGNGGNYLDARGVLNPNGAGNASEMIAGTESNDSINGLGGNDTIYGDGGNDTIEGGDGNDFLRGGIGIDQLTDTGGDDHMWGDAGNDSMSGGTGLDIMFGGDGDDTMLGGMGLDAIQGNDGNDTIYGDFNDPNRLNVLGDADAILGGAGNDRIWGGGGNDTIDGGDGDDFIVGGQGVDAMLGGAGDDLFEMDAMEFGVGNTVDGGTGYDTIDYSKARGIALNTGLTVNLANVGVGVAPIGANPPDAILNVESVIGTAFADTLSARPLGGAAGAPPQPVFLLDAFGNQVLDANGNPIVVNFTFEGLGGNDTIEGGAGTGDWVAYTRATGAVNVDLGNGRGTGGGSGTDTISLIENIRGSAFDDRLTGDNNDNEIEGGLGADRIDGAGGSDTVSYEHYNAGVIVNLATNTNNTTDTLISIENAKGSALNDTLTAIAGGSRLWGLAGNDALNGSASADVLDGGVGVDTMIGLGGNDTYVVDNVGDVVTEGANAGTDAVQTTLVSYTLGANVENLTNIGQAGFTGTGNTLVNVITGSAGADALDGGNDGVVVDRLVGGLGDDKYTVDVNTARTGFVDTIVEAANAGFDTVVLRNNGGLTTDISLTLAANLEGLDARNVENTTRVNLTGNAADNRLFGNDAANTFTGGAGFDTMTGGLGVDTFVFGPDVADISSATQMDRITDFAAADILNLTAIDINTVTPGQQIFEFRTDGATGTTFNNGATFATGSAAFTAAGQLRLQNGVLYGNTDNDAEAEFQIALDGVTSLTSANFTPPPPIVASIQALAVPGAEGQTGSAPATLFTYTVTLSRAPGLVPVTMSWAVAGVAAAGTGAAANTDFVGNVLPTGTLAFSGNTTSQTITVSVLGDTVVESNESFTVTLSNPSAGTNLGTASVTSTIVNDDIPPPPPPPPPGPGPGPVATNGTAAADTLTGTAGADQIFGFAGNDTIFGLDGNDLLDGGLGNDVLWGGAGNDSLYGGTGVDTLNGEAGSDNLYGSAGQDFMSGGLNNDFFIFGANIAEIGNVGRGSSFSDRITDFSTAEGDKIDLSAIDSNTGLANDQAFTFIGTGNFTAAGQIRYAGGLLQGNVDGNLGADFTITLTNNPASLAATDFIL